jgi:hypothetical protein
VTNSLLREIFSKYNFYPQKSKFIIPQTLTYPISPQHDDITPSLGSSSAATASINFIMCGTWGCTKLMSAIKINNILFDCFCIYRYYHDIKNFLSAYNGWKFVASVRLYKIVRVTDFLHQDDEMYNPEIEHNLTCNKVHPKTQQHVVCTIIL